MQERWLLVVDKATSRVAGMTVWTSANADLDPTENSGGFVPVTCLSVVDQDERPLSQSAKSNTRPKAASSLSVRSTAGN